MTHRRAWFALCVAGLGLAACRGDSVSSPQQSSCTGQPGCPVAPGAPVSANVVVAVDDARMRLVANLPDADARTALDADFSTLDKALLDNRVADARTALATIYSRLASMRVAGSGGTLVDTPDAAAIRLDLVPTATALGVVAQ